MVEKVKLSNIPIYGSSRSENVTLQEMEAVPTELKNVYNIPCVDMIEILTRFKGKLTVRFESPSINA